MIWACPSHTTAFVIFVNVFISLFKNDKKCRLKISFGCGRLWCVQVGLLRASLSLRQSLRRFAPQGSAGGSLRSPPPSASLTQFPTNYRWWLFTLLNSCFANLTGFTLINKDTFNRVNIKPLRGLAEFTFSYSPPSLNVIKLSNKYMIFIKLRHQKNKI